MQLEHQVAITAGGGPGLVEGRPVPGLREEPAVVGVPVGNKDLDVGDGGGDDSHRSAHD